MSVQRIWAAMTAFVTSLVLGLGPALAQSAAPAGQVGAPRPWQLGLQEPASPQMAKLAEFHDLLMIIITVITLFVLGLLVYVIVRFNHKANPNPSRTSHNTLLEVAWTALPVLILVVIAVPSFQILYFLDRAENPEMTVKVTGRQWYWDYEYPDNGGVAFSSYIVEEKDLPPGGQRILDVDNRVVVPVGTQIRLLMTGGDVIHSWAVPALGVKLDAIPGRVNETWVQIDREGVYYGQCSEICGTGHGFMPIAVEAVSKEKFTQWVNQKKTAMGGGAAATQVAQQAR